jgi:hypothetical protein
MTNGIGKPSQAEGDRETIEADLRRYESGSDAQGADAPAAAGQQTRPSVDADYSIDKPSQAEGDRETVEEDLRRREGRG